MTKRCGQSSGFRYCGNIASWVYNTGTRKRNICNSCAENLKARNPKAKLTGFDGSAYQKLPHQTQVTDRECLG